MQCKLKRANIPLLYIEYLKENSIWWRLYFLVTAVNKLQENVYAEVKNWFDNLPGMQRNQISRHFGGFPNYDADFQGNPNSTAWLWKVLPILPLDPRIQLTMLAMTSYKERLEGIQRVVEYIKRRQSSWLAQIPGLLDYLFCNYQIVIGLVILIALFIQVAIWTIFFAWSCIYFFEHYPFLIQINTCCR